jgi:hypothetical protein
MNSPYVDSRKEMSADRFQGVNDGVVPIEDCMVLMNHGGPKEGRFFENLVHMGYPHSLPVAYKWLESVLSPNTTQVKN